MKFCANMHNCKLCIHELKSLMKFFSALIRCALPNSFNCISDAYITSPNGQMYLYITCDTIRYDSYKEIKLMT